MKTVRLKELQWQSILDRLKSHNFGLECADMLIDQQGVWLNPNSKRYQLLMQRPFGNEEIMKDPYAICRWLGKQGIDSIAVSDSAKEVVAIFILF